jgi:exportin-2 (importin alpha re-exporter)
MASVSPAIQTQLGEAISVIADSDFWERWDTLIDDLVSRLTPANAQVNNGVLQVAHSIFKRWRPLFKSDELYIEINHVLGKFAKPFLLLLENTDKAIAATQNDKAALKAHYETLNLIIRIFYDLSCHDLAPDFEDNIAAIAGVWHKYLIYDNPLLHTDTDEESGPLEFVRTGILEAAALYIDQFDDAFGSFIPQFVESSWHLLTSIGPETKYDVMVSKALQFLTTIAKRPGRAQTFGNEATLNQVVEKVILPNLALREVDVELFEDEPIEYIRRDLEGSDADTRRRAATDFLRALMEQFEQLVTQVVSKYIKHYLDDYSKNRGENWKSKDTAVYLFCSIAAKGVPTQALGVKTVNPNVDILDFFKQYIAEDLDAPNVHPVLQVDSIKYIYFFRSQLTQQYWHAAFPLLVKHLNSPNYVIYTYAAIAVERVLYLSSDERSPIIPKVNIVALSKDLLQHLFGVIQKDSAPEKVQENEFLMRCVMRVLLVVKEGILPNIDMVLRNLINITMVIRHNPSNPHFYYYHFEAIGALIKSISPTHPEMMEKALYSPFAAILQGGVTEFEPYVFQLFAALLEANPSGKLSDYYLGLIQPILMPTLWESKGNVPALVRLLSAIIARGVNEMAENKQIEPTLGVFQKLVSSKLHETQGFDLLEAIITNFPAEVLKPYFVPMIQIMLTRLSTSKTQNFTLRFVRFYHLFSSRDDKGLGADFFIANADQVQQEYVFRLILSLDTKLTHAPSVFRPVYTSIILPDTQKLTKPIDRKVAVVSFTKTLSDSQAFVTRYSKGWALTCEALLKLLINPPNVVAAQSNAAAADANIVVGEQDLDDQSFSVGFTQLQTCKKQSRDLYPEITDVKAWVGSYLKQADARNNGRIAGYVRERLAPQAKQALATLMG